MWKDHGWLPWGSLFEPTIELAEHGIKVSKAMTMPLRFAQNKSRKLKYFDEDFL